jgi:chromate reductase
MSFRGAQLRFNSKDHPMNILAISGSLRADSFNTRLLKAALNLFPEGADSTLLSIDLPLYNEELDGMEKPAAVDAAKAAIARADAILIATPEYNYGIPGGLKNALDWISRPAYKSPIVGKPVAIMSASMSPVGGARVQGQLKQVLGGMLANVYPAPEFLVPQAQKVFAANGELLDEEMAKRLARFIGDFYAEVAARRQAGIPN